MNFYVKKDAYNRSDLWAFMVLGLFWCLFFVTAKSAFSLSLVDDAYIFLRVVENIISGEGWVYNPSDTSGVNPLTSPLFPLFVLLLRLAGLTMESAIINVYILSLVVLSVFQYLGFRGLGRGNAVLISLLTSASGILIKSFGMETSLFLACIAGTAYAFHERKYMLMGVLAGLTALARPEGAALLFVVAFLTWQREKRVPVSSIIIGLFIISPWVVFSLTQFGSVLPHTVSIKAVQTDLPWFSHEYNWLVFFLRQPSYELLTYSLSIIGAWKMLALCRTGYLYAVPIIMFGVIQVAAYSIMKAPVGYWWYLAPGALALDILVVLGIIILSEKLLTAKVWSKGHFLHKYGKNTLLVFVFILTIFMKLTTSPFKTIKEYRLASDYRNVAHWISNNTPRASRVAATEIGYIGYYSKRPILDIHGLIHKDALSFIKRGESDWWFDRKPEIVVSHRSPWYGEPGNNEWFKKTNQDIFENNYDEVYSSGDVVVYRRY